MSLRRYEARERAIAIWGEAAKHPDAIEVADADAGTWSIRVPVMITVHGNTRVRFDHHTLDANGHARCHGRCEMLAAASARPGVPPDPTWLSAGETCEETTGMVGEAYLRCGRPAVMAVYHKGRREPVYKMCRACGTHNVNNRGAIELVPVEQEKR